MATLSACVSSTAQIVIAISTGPSPPVGNVQLCQHILQVCLLSTGQRSCHIGEAAQVLEVTPKLEGALQLLPVDGVLSQQVFEAGHQLHVCGLHYVITRAVW